MTRPTQQLSELKELKVLPELLEQVAAQAQCVVRLLQLDGTALVQKTADGGEASTGCLAEGRAQEVIEKWAGGSPSDDVSCGCGHPLTMLPVRCKEQVDGILTFCPATPEKTPLLVCLADMLSKYVSLARSGLDLWTEHASMLAAYRELYVETESLTDVDKVPMIALQIAKKYLEADVFMYLPRDDADSGWERPVMLTGAELPQDWLDSLAREFMAGHDENQCPLILASENRADHPRFARFELSSFISATVSFEQRTLGRLAVCSVTPDPTLSYSNLPLLETLGLTMSVRIHDLQTRSLKEKFFDRALHQINTPVHSVREIVRILNSDRDASPEERQTWLNYLSEETERLERFVRMASEFSKHQKRKLSKERLDLSKLVSDISRSTRREVNQRQVAVMAVTPGHACEVVGDEMILYSALQSLVENAIKFSPRGGEVLIELTDEGARYRVSVSDQGPGVPPEQREVIFEECVSITRDGVPEGSGLGLAMARAAVEGHGGELTCGDAAGHQGACFSFTIPRAGVEE